jgi:hypothetical protein
LPSESQSFVWDVSDPQQMKPVDIYSSEWARRLSLSDRNLAAAKATFARHDLDKRPDNVEYTFVFGTDHETDQKFLVKELNVKAQADFLGDGTVPSASAGFVGSKPGIATWSTPGDHVGILAVQAFREFLTGYIGGSSQLRRQAGRTGRTVVLSPNKRIYSPGDRISVLIIPDQDVSTLDATINTEFYDEKRGQLMRKTAKPVSFRGGPTKFIPVEISAPTKPGGYRLTMGGSHKTIEGTHGWFVVSHTARRATKIKRVRVRRRPHRLAKIRASRR